MSAVPLSGGKSAPWVGVVYEVPEQEKDEVLAAFAAHKGEVTDRAGEGTTVQNPGS